MQIRTNEVDHTVFQQFLRHLLLGFSIITRKTQQIDLEHQSGVMQLLVPRRFTVIICVAFGMCENRSEAAHLKVENQLIQIPWFLHERVFNQQI